MKNVCIIGLGNIGLTLALAFAQSHKIRTIGVDINPIRLNELRLKIDSNGEHSPEEFRETLLLTDTIPIADYYLVCVPTPTNDKMQPNLDYVYKAATSIGKIAPENAIIILESTVAPGTTDGKFRLTALKSSSHKKLHFAFSPERINSGDKTNTLRNTVKIVGASDKSVLANVTKLYKLICNNVHSVSTAIAAELTKVSENTLRDVNIAFMNEIAVIARSHKISIWEIRDAMATKWNYPGFSPGLVGGHGISVDPFYLIEQADARGYNLPIIKSARNFNLNLAKDYAYFIHEEITLLAPDKPKAIIIYGLSFKSNSKDVRNSQTISLAQAFLQLNYHVTISDPIVKKIDFQKEWLKINHNPMPSNIKLLSHNRAFSKSNASEYDVVVVALNHKHYRDKSARRFQMQVAPQGLLIDLQNTLPELSNWENYRSI